MHPHLPLSPGKITSLHLERKAVIYICSDLITSAAVLDYIARFDSN
jgi:hypothetical protein